MKKILCLLLVLLSITSSSCLLSAYAEEKRFCDGYNGSSYERSESLTISYATKDETEIAINGNLPLYYNTGNYTNTCANTAGAIILGYYDRTYTNLIENFTPARIIGNRIIYYSQNTVVQNVINTLYVDMGTNANGSSGTTITGFKNGLRDYVNRQGYSITYNGIGSYSTFSTTNYTNAINSEKPVVIFASGYVLANLTNTETNSDTYSLDYYSGNHVVVGCGIKIVSYHNATGNLMRECVFLRIASGYYLDGIEYFFLNNYGSIIDSYSVNIY